MFNLTLWNLMKEKVYQTFRKYSKVYNTTPLATLQVAGDNSTYLLDTNLR